MGCIEAVVSPSDALEGRPGGLAALSLHSTNRTMPISPGSGLGGFSVERPRESSSSLGDVSAAQALATAVGGWAGGSSPSTASRQEVIAFDGIPDPVSVGRQVSGRL